MGHERADIDSVGVLVPKVSTHFSFQFPPHVRIEVVNRNATGGEDSGKQWKESDTHLRILL